MGFSGTQSIDRRDAAVTALLAGAVVVILGYASGIGLRQPATPTAIQLPAPEQAEEIPQTPLVPAFAPVVPGLPVLPVARVHDHPPATEPAPTPSPAKPTSAPTATAKPTPRPTPTTARPAACGLALLPALELEVVEPVTSLLSVVVASLPLPDLPIANTDELRDTLACTVGSAEAGR